MRKKQTVLPPAPLPGFTKDTPLKILGVTITGNLSASDHIHHPWSSQRLFPDSIIYMLFGCYEIMACDAGLQAVFRSVVVAKILYASTAWSGFITATHRQRVDAFLRRSMMWILSTRLAVIWVAAGRRRSTVVQQDKCSTRSSLTPPSTFSSFTALWTETKSAHQRTACPYWQTHWLLRASTDVYKLNN